MPKPTGFTASDRPKTLGTNSTGTYRGAYNAATAYAAGDIVLYNGAYFKKLDAAVAGTTPTYASTSWEPAVVAGSGQKILDSSVVGGTSSRIMIGDYEGQPSSSRLAKESSRTALEA